MLRKALGLILIFSLALNFAFVGVWAYHRFYIRHHRPDVRWNRRGDDDRRGFRDMDHRAEKEKEGFERRLPELLARDKEYWKKVGKTRHSLMAEHEKLFDLLSGEETDREAINACLDRIAELRDDMQRLVVDHVLSVKENLGSEQSKKLMYFLRRKALGPGEGRNFRHGPGKPHDPRGKHGPEGRKQSGPPRLPFTSFLYPFSWEVGACLQGN